VFYTTLFTFQGSTTRTYTHTYTHTHKWNLTRSNQLHIYKTLLGALCTKTAYHIVVLLFIRAILWVALVYVLYVFSLSWLFWFVSTHGASDWLQRLVSEMTYNDPAHSLTVLIYYAALLPRRGRILCRTLSVCPSVCPSRARMYFVYSCTVLRANIQNRKTSGFAYGPASRVYFSARAEGRISYGHLGRTNSCLFSLIPVWFVMAILTVVANKWLVWLGGRMVRTLDWRSVGREFDSWPPRYRVQPWASC